MNAFFETLRQKVLTLSQPETDETEPELSAFGIVQVQLERMRNDLATLQKSIDALHTKMDALQTVNTFQHEPEPVNTLAENEMLTQIATVNTLDTKPAAKRRKPAVRK